MTAKAAIPDAWEDDWVTQADVRNHKTPSFPQLILAQKQVEEPPPESVSSSGKVSKAERRARQAELNKKLWEEASVTPSQIGALPHLNSIYMIEKRPRPSTSSRPVTTSL